MSNNKDVINIDVYKFISYSPKPILFMMEGLVASGKSYVSEKIEVIRNGNIIKPNIHSSDTLRDELYGNINEQTHNTELFQELHKRIKEDLRKGKDVVYDATNINKKRRRAFLNDISQIDCYKICICMLVPYEVCLEQNKSRKRNIPEDVIKRMYLCWSPPSLDEGFDYIVLAYNYGFVDKNKYTIENFFNGTINANRIEHNNSHHKLTIGFHCLSAADYIEEHYPDNYLLKMAALLHDIGKPFTKSYLNSHGEIDTNCHYYNHQNCGSYDSFFYLDVLGLSQNEILHIANLIYYHMMPFMVFRQSKKAENRVRKQVGEEFFNEIMKLHEADVYAH